MIWIFSAHNLSIISCWTSNGVSDANNLPVGQRFFLHPCQLRLAFALFGLDALLRGKLSRRDQLLLFKRLLRRDLFVLNGLFEGGAKIHVIEQQVDNIESSTVKVQLRVVAAPPAGSFLG